MESDSKKCKHSEENDGRDRLSELPDQVLLHILSKMPTLHAVRTVLLSRFGNLWTLLPSLDFDDNSILFGKKLFAGNVNGEKIGDSEVNACFTSFVRNVLLFHKRANIDKFELVIGDLEWLDDNSPSSQAVLDEIRMWTKFAIEKEVEVLDFQFICCHVDASVLPRCLFTSRFLVELRLNRVEIKHLSHVHMGSLKSLYLSRFEISNELFKKLISGCPSLELLDIEDQYELDELRFTTPSIEQLQLYANPCLLDCPNVKVLSLWLYDRLSPPNVVDVSSLREVIVWSLDSADQINELVKMFHKVEVFKLCPEVVRPLQLMDPDLPQTRWKQLDINSRLHNEEELLSICRILRSSPHLEVLKVEHFKNLLNREDCSKLSLELPPFVMPKLKSVTLCGYKVSCRGLIQVVEFFLKSAHVLEKMVIVPKKYELAAFDEVEFVKKLSGFARASTTAKVVIGLNVY